MSSYQAPKKMKFLSPLPSDNENSERESNPIPPPVYTYLSESAFLANLTCPNKQYF